ncbi:TetR/AcrR family transcriptional regulator [Actinomadura sp. WMMA1423]|uniref:TetR/AcrR family transcriptional regulator n=1 Tax=Actinomadura sp. WMMA1423 TaxID=2591108 RepID=UPI001147553F|nr:TetR/AcrR family transcriptional regulator [Actinomadura sp. WMMA1423]
MTNEGRRTETHRGRRRREQLLQIGLDLLAEGGWPAVTARAVAERGGIKPGLLHHYFGGLPGFHIAVAAKAHALVTEPLLNAVLAVPDVATVATSAPHVVATRFTDTRDLRLAREVLGRALRDPTMGAQRYRWLRQGHEEVAVRLADMHPQWTPQHRDRTASLLAALVDGLMMERILDPGPANGSADVPATGPNSPER